MAYTNLYLKMPVFFWVIIFCLSCGSYQHDPVVPPKPAVAAAVTVSLATVAQFDTLENLFQNDNWLVIKGSDSSYVYASRLGKTIFRTYHFRMVKGDSVNTVITQIQFKGDTLGWQWPPDTAAQYLTSTAAGKLIWADGTGKQKYVFEKISRDHIKLLYPDGKYAELIKTPALSSFLIRSKYDYQHGTRLAFTTEK